MCALDFVHQARGPEVSFSIFKGMARDHDGPVVGVLCQVGRLLFKCLGDGGVSETGKRSAQRLPLFVAKTFFVPPKWTKVNKALTNLCQSLRQTRF